MSDLTWQSPYETHEYNPLYLANSHFGGVVGLSGTDMSLWSSSIVAKNLNGEREGEPLFPVTAIRTRCFFQNEIHKEKEFYVGRSGIFSNDPFYTSHETIPHLPQMYHCEQSLDLETGTALTKGTLYTGSQAGLEADPGNPRAIPFESKKAFLLGSPYAEFVIRSHDSTDIIFTLESILEEQLTAKISGTGILSWGSMLVDCDFRFRKNIVQKEVSENRIHLTVQPEGVEDCYQVIATSRNGSSTHFHNNPGFKATGQLDIRICILRAGQSEDEAVAKLSSEEFFAEQAKRWQAFKNQATVTLPPEESFWQERYETGLFQIVQSLGYGPTHPVGISKPHLPFWFGSFHDTDTYFCRPMLERGAFEIAKQNLDFRHRNLDSAYAYAKRANAPGAMYPWQCDPHATGGWAEGDCLTNHAIIASEAWFQYTHSRDRDTGEKAVDVLSGIFENLASHIDFDGETAELLDHSLATFSETMEVSRPNEAILSIRAVSQYLIEAREAGFEIKPDFLEQAERILSDLHPYTNQDGSYKYSEQADPEYMRCPSLMLTSFPLHAIPADERLKATFDDELSKITFLFSWLPHQASITASQLQVTEGSQSAAELLRQADTHYRNFHAPDEWENRRIGRPPIFVTSAGGFCTAIHNILVTETSPNTWTLFAGAPKAWKDASFENLVLRNGWKVSGKMEDGVVTSFEATPPADFIGPHPRFANAPETAAAPASPSFA